jgi:predicted 3-demethylubiquinone-9 3-methyltransferase (glyoxalase superfamily)
MQKITPFLWFDGQAEQAAEFYTNVFKDSKITNVTRYGEAGPLPAGTAMTVSFVLDGTEFVALNGGPVPFAFTEATSFYVDCESQDEVDEKWARLVEGGEPGNCGWLKDKFGLSWQIVPSELPTLLGDPDPGRSSRAMQAMLGMNKIDIQAMRDAADDKTA